jgi:exonuclease III
MQREGSRTELKARGGAAVCLMKLKILSWNVRGLNEEEKRMRMKGLIREWMEDIVYLQETKLQFINREVLRSLWGCTHVDWCFLESRGASRGILIMWDRSVVEKLDDCVGRFIVACSFRSVNDNFEWVFTGVYGPNNDYDRKMLWDELVGIMSWWEKPWCIGGDFKAIRYPSERLGDTQYSSAMREFFDFIFEQGFMDIPLVGVKLTWSNNYC